MDRDVPARVTYWTGTWDPEREAISKEVETLRRLQHPRGTVVGFSPGNRTAFRARDGVITLSAGWWMVFRACAAALEPRGDVTHAFGGVDAWHLLRSLGRRPFLFTAVAPGAALAPALYEGVSHFVAESEPLAVSLRDAGVPADRISVVYPGVDLECFAPTPLPWSDRFRVLFASSPADPAEIETRGVGLLVELARRHPDIEVIALWRQWGAVGRSRKLLLKLAPPSNFHVEELGSRRMSQVYASVHATACLFAEGVGKSCPNSVVESLACGRPALVSRTCGIAGVLEASGAGVSSELNPDALDAALDRLRGNLVGLSARARRLAEDQFGMERFCRTYLELYERLSESGCAVDRSQVTDYRASA